MHSYTIFGELDHRKHIYNSACIINENDSIEINDLGLRKKIPSLEC